MSWWIESCPRLEKSLPTWLTTENSFNDQWLTKVSYLSKNEHPKDHSQ